LWPFAWRVHRTSSKRVRPVRLRGAARHSITLFLSAGALCVKARRQDWNPTQRPAGGWKAGMPHESQSPGRRLRQAWKNQAIPVPGVFNALVARMAERLGYHAVYLSGAALSAGFGVPDVGLLSLTEFVDQARIIAQATSLPLLCDADTGFGEALNVERTVRLFENAGVAGIHLEDQQLPKRCGHLSGKALVDA